MLPKTDKSLGRRDCGAPAGWRPIGDDVLQALIDRLRHLGFGVPPFYGSRCNVAGGVPLQLAAQQLLRPPAGTDSPQAAIRALLAEDTPFTLSLSDLGQGDAAIDAMQGVCRILQAEVANNGRCGKKVGISVHARQLPLQAFRVITDTVPGAGPRYVLLDESQMTPQGDRSLRASTEKTWCLLWRQRIDLAPLVPAYGAVIRTACPLLADEAAASVLPVHGIQAPVDSAWLPVNLSLPHFADACGEISWDRLLPALTDGVDLADKIMQRLDWPYIHQQRDARLNRRLAITITGLGDLVRRRAMDPQDHDALQWLSAIVIRIRKKLWQRSAALARDNGCLPVLRSSAPSRQWNDSAHREHWRQRWEIALQRSAVRHRNMLVMSPYAVLPSAISCDVAYTDLLPVIACADAWSFADPPPMQSWNFNDYKAFHRRAWAVIQGRNSGTLVAAGA